MTFSSDGPRSDAYGTIETESFTEANQWEADGTTYKPQKGKRKSTMILIMALFAVTFVVGISVLLWSYAEDNDSCENAFVIENSIIHKGNIIDPDVNPCDDFYTFACGRWNLSVSHHGFISVFEETEVRNLLRLESYLRCSSFRDEPAWGRYMKKTFDLCEKGRTASIRKSRTVSFVREMAAPLFKQSGSRLDDTLRRIHHKLLQTGLFSWDVNLERHKDRIIQGVKITPPKVIKGKELMFATRNHLANYIKEVALLLGIEGENVEEKCDRIAEVSFAIDQTANITEITPLTAELDYQKFVDEFDFIDFNDYFEGYSLPENISVANVGYFHWLKNYLRMRNDGSVQDFLIWSAIDHFVPYMPKEFLEIRRKYTQRSTTRARDLMEESHACVYAVKTGMNFAAASYFMEKTVDEETREMVAEITLHVKNAFRDYVNRIRKSHPEEREWFAGLGRVFRNIQIGVPNHFRKLYEEEVELPAETKSFPSQLLSAYKFTKGEMMKHLDEPPYAALYQVDFLRVNGVFMTMPMILVYLGILTPPVFDPNQPLHMNYAGLGFVLSHELAHSVLYLGSNTVTILMDIALKFLCLRFMHTNSTQGYAKSEEDFADAVAVQVAYNAYLEHYGLHNSDREPTIMEKKLFFLHYSQFLCESGSTFSTEMNSFHSPFKTRVNVPLSNSPQFSEIFSCPVGSPMNAEQKCVL